MTCMGFNVPRTGLAQLFQRTSSNRRSSLLLLCNVRFAPLLSQTKKPLSEAEGSWCPGLDSNQHTLRRCYLKTVRLPISPPGQRGFEQTVRILIGGANIWKDRYVPKYVEVE